MKKLLTLFALIGLFATACEEEGVNEPTNDKPIEKPDDGNDDTEKPVFEINGDGNYIVEAVGGTVAVKVTTNLEYDVVIDEDAQSWLSVADTRAVREETLIFTVAENESFDERSATVELKGADGKVLQSVSFKQKGVEKVFDTDSEGNYIVEADGGTVAIKVTTNLEYDVIIPNEALAWISLADTRAVREETLTFNVAKNENSEERSATVNLCAKGGDILQTITIKQNKSNAISCANNEVIYTTKYGYPIELNITEGFGGNLMSHTYENGYGRISFDNDVVSIPNEAFKDCTTLTTIVLPNSLSTIDSSAFENCTSLTSITIPDSVTTIGSSAFYYCTLLTSVTIGNGVTEIGEDAFYGCTSLTRFNGKFASEDNRCLIFDGELVAFARAGLTEYAIPDSVTKIGRSAFYGCTSLTNITIPDSVTTIGSRAFYGCTSLTNVTIGNSVTKIGGYAFCNCTGELIVNCNIPSATYYVYGAFYGADFTKVTIGDSVTSIGDYAFYGCTGELIVNCNIPSATDYVNEGAFYGADFTKVTIGDSVTSIGDCAFYGCTSLTSITIGNGVTEIGKSAFSGCTSLTRFNGKFASEDNRCLIFDGELAAFARAGLTEYAIPDSVTSIGSYAFYNCTSLTSITIPDSVTKIGKGAFYDCTSLTSITIPDSVTEIGEEAFYNCTGELIVNCNIPSATDSKNGAFYGADFTKVTIGDSVTTIGSSAFYYCTLLTSVTIGNGVTKIGEEAFYNCTSLTSITIPNSVTTIGSGAFDGCTSLTSITIPDSVTSIGSYAFSYCSSLTEVYCMPTTPPTGGSNMFYNNALFLSIYVPMESVSAYESANYWRDIADKIVGYNF